MSDPARPPGITQWVLATRNPAKLAEIRAILGAPALELLSALDFPDVPDVIEDGDTFEANACKKARALAAATGCPALADDSGLVVDALDGAPGVYSARYAGPHANPAANNAKLLAALENVSDRTARFRCVIALATPAGDVQTVSGACEGQIARTPRGAGGFGYDPLFIPNGHARTFGELDPATKHQLSHRGQALRRALTAWINHAPPK